MRPLVFENSHILIGQMLYLPNFLPAQFPGSVDMLSLTLADGRIIKVPYTENAMDQLCTALTACQKRPRCDHLDAEKTFIWRNAQGIPQPQVLISACLAGECCRYDGGDNLLPQIAALMQTGTAVPICPECAGNLPTPRTPCEIRGQRVIDRDGIDRTDAFCRGAQLTLQTAQIFGIQSAILKERSPSCGVYLIYDGSFSGIRIPGQGICAHLLYENGITLQSEEDFSK